MKLTDVLEKGMRMEEWLTQIMNDYGYIGIMYLIALENLFPPIPSEVILTFGGFMTTLSTLNVPGVVLSATAGSVFGAIILYLIGLQLDTERLERIVDRFGHILRVTREDIYKAEAWFHRYGPWTVFFCRFVPLIRSLISVPAGMARMPFIQFLLLTAIGTLIWNIVLVLLGASVGESWETIVYYMDIYSNVIYVMLLVLILLFTILFIRKRK
jgi:membrane protein DedA with SNARE-associated domain